MEHKPIELTINVSIGVPDRHQVGLRNALSGDESEDYLYDCLCSWIRRYTPPDMISFDLELSVTPTK